MIKDETVELIDGKSFLDNLEERLILKNGKEEHAHLKSKYEKEIEIKEEIRD